MPFRQSLLNFKPTPSTVQSIEHAAQMTTRKPTFNRMNSSMSSEFESDVIVVNTSTTRDQLPTPSESVTDVSSVSSQVVKMKTVPKGRGKRVSRRRMENTSEDCLIDSAEVDVPDGDLRNVSGNTLVNSSSASQSSLAKDGAAVLDVPWSMSGRLEAGSRTTHSEDFETSSDQKSVNTLQSSGLENFAKSEELIEEDVEDPEADIKRKQREEKIEENRRLREERYKAADEKATRRSSRASMFEKAGNIVSDLATTVLGKRKDRVTELRGGSRPGSAVELLGAGNAVNIVTTTDSKKRRLSEGDAALDSVARKSSLRKREKRWLTAGLYAGQSRTFDGRLTESKNKSKVANDLTTLKENSILPLPMFAGERLWKFGRDFKLPFDVFSPLPAGQPKPDEWRKVNKNVFIGDAAHEWRTSKFIEHSACMCKAETGCDHNCMNRYMYYECDERNCNLSEEKCGNRSFEGLKQRTKKGGKYNVGVEVIKTADRGYGVRSNRTFEANQIIVEYTGEIITQEECESRMRTIYKDNECYYLMLFDQNMIIDATRGSIARFVNHSCEPNCRMEKWTVGGKPRMALFAGDRSIMTGEELTYDYNFDPYSQKNVQECRCGASTCRGVLGPKPKDAGRKNSPEEEKAQPNSKVKGIKRKVVEVLEESTSRLNKKPKLDSKPKAKVNAPLSPAKQNPIKTSKTKSKLVKKSPIRKKSAPIRTISTTASLTRQPSKLKRIVASARSKTTITKTIHSPVKNKRITSTSSAGQALLSKDTNTASATTGVKKSLGRTSSLKVKAESIKRGVVRTMKGAQHGRGRSMRAVLDEIGE